MSTTREPAPSTTTDPGAARFLRRDWIVVAALAAGLVIGFAAARILDHGQRPAPGTMRSGTVDSIDPDGSVCVSLVGAVSCYQAPGLGLVTGQRIWFRIESQPLDPTDPGKGTQEALVWVARR